MHSIVKVDSKAGIEIFSIYLIRSPQHSTHCIRSLNYLLSVKTGLLLLHYALYNCTGWSVRGSGALWLLLGRSGSATVATTTKQVPGNSRRSCTSWRGWRWWSLSWWPRTIWGQSELDGSPVVAGATIDLWTGWRAEWGSRIGTQLSQWHLLIQNEFVSFLDVVSIQRFVGPFHFLGTRVLDRHLIAVIQFHVLSGHAKPLVQKALKLCNGLLQVDDFFPHTILLVTHFDLKILIKEDVLNDDAIS